MTVNGVNGSAGTKKATKTDNTKTSVNKDNTAKKTNANSQIDSKTVEDSLQSYEINDTANVNSALQSGISGIKTQLASAEESSQNEMKLYYEQLENLREQLAEINEQARSISDLLRSGASDAATCQSSLAALRGQRNAIYENINMMLLNIKSLESSAQTTREQALNTINQLANSASSSAVNAVTNTSAANILSSVKSNINSTNGFGNAICQIGNAFVGKINTDAQGNAAFSPGGVSQAWCADFVTYVVKKSCEMTGNTLPAGFGSSAVAGILAWGKQNGRFIQTSGQANKAQIIAQNVKPGDLFVKQEGGSSHVGIVTKVNSDGSFETVEGNSSDAVRNRSYTANLQNLTGFVKMS